MKHLITLILIICLSTTSSLLSINKEQQQEPTIQLRGRVLGGDSNQPLVNASVTTDLINISTITNQEGYFSIRVPASSRNSKLIIRHIGYSNRDIPIATLIESPNNHITLIPSPIELGELQVVSGDGSQLVKDALYKIPQNYSSTPNMMIAFYRESIKKGSRYISLVETVLDVYKASYRSYNNDQARIYIGRKATDITPRDTVLLKFQGGISDALMLDIAKNPEIVFGTDASEYSYQIEGLINFNNKPHYKISFYPLSSIEDILFRGNIYLEYESLSIARMEFNMNVENRKDAAKIFIRRKPSKMRVDVEKAQYIIDYIENNGKWYFNYSATDVEFKVRWTNRFFGLFSTNYIISSEIAITDRYNDNVLKFARDERIKSTDVIAERVEYFLDPTFWGEYNVIEPDQEITDAIQRLSDKLRRRSE
jgi:hypothetical protein